MHNRDRESEKLGGIVDIELPTISVVVPFKRSERAVLDCLQSIFDMRYPMEKLEVIVVDDSQDDATANLIRRQFPIARILRNCKPLGCDGSKQAGIDAANGDLVALTDADCTVPPGWAQSIAKNLTNGTEVVTGPVSHPKTFLRELIGIADFQDFQSDNYQWVANFPGCNVGMQRDVVRKTGYILFPDMWFGSDRLASWRMHSGGFRIRYDPAVTVRHFPDVSFSHLLERRMRYGRKALKLRRLDRTLPGAVITRFGLLAAPAYIAFKTLKDVCRLIEMTWRRQVSPWHVPALLPMMLVFRILDAVGVVTAWRLQGTATSIKNKKGRLI